MPAPSRKRLQVHCVTSALMEYLKVDLIPKHPAACHELGTYVYPHIHLEGTCHVNIIPGSRVLSCRKSIAAR